MAAISQRSIGGHLHPAGYQKTQTPVVPRGASLVVITPEADIRYRDDGTAPDASTGMPIAAGQTFVYSGDLTLLQLSGEANLAFYR